MRARLALALLQASGALGSLGPRLAALCARAAEAASDAAHLVSPMATCEGCGAAVPALALVGVEVCGACAEREGEGPAPAPPFGPPDGAPNADAFWLALLVHDDAPRINVLPVRGATKPN